MKVNTGLVAQDSGIVIGGAFERVHERTINRLAKLKQEGTDDVLYAATDAGVYVWDKYYANATGPDGRWLCFSHNLPNCAITDLEIAQCEGKLRVGMWGRGIWQTDLPKIPAARIRYQEIAANTTWASSRAVNENMVVKSGAILTINNGAVIRLAKNVTITIEPGAKLMADGATLTNACGAMWGGIIVQGSKTLPQDLSSHDNAAATSTNQGFVYLNNATIENAYEALRIWNPADGWVQSDDVSAQGGTGGIVRVVNNMSLKDAHKGADSKISVTRTGNDLTLYYKELGISRIHFIRKNANQEWTETAINTHKLMFGPYTGLYWVQMAPDVVSDITPTTHSRIYYRGNNNELKYYVPDLLTGYINKNAQRYKWNIKVNVNNCAGQIFVNNDQNVYYKGTDNNLWIWNPATEQLSSYTNGTDAGSVNNNGMVAGAHVVAKCGCLAFYRDAQHRLRQLYWWNGWHELSQPVADLGAVQVTDEMVLDEERGRVYFIASDHSVYYYQYDYAAYNPTGLVRLDYRSVHDSNHNTQMCSQYYNAACNLTVSKNGNMLLYKATDGKLWYYFNDKEFSTITVPTIGTVTRSLENWNRAPLNYTETATGRMAMEHLDFGRLFYLGKKSRVTEAQWANADNMINCSITEDVSSNQNVFKTNEVSAIPELLTGANGITVYPNPSDNSFNFALSQPNCNVSTLTVYDMNGRTLYTATNDSGNWVWNAGDTGSGVYYYRVVGCDDKRYTGKLIKY
ncbi:MAG: T9SS type A sorting domain-containing protein [Chitinophagales bacterium]|nr:T9SS type A sorting domain-containing protein [Chitinophagales bacterium]